MKKRKPQCIRQSRIEDCRHAAIATIVKHYGRSITIEFARQIIGTGQQGSTMTDLHRGAERLGFNARPVKTSPEIINRLDEAPLPAIIHLNGIHWGVLFGKQGKKFIVGDPAEGLRYLSEKELKKYWSDWIMLLLEPDPMRFYKELGDDKKQHSIN